MNMEEIYGPEDIEKLLLSKDFSDLYPEERDYVLRHMEGEEEYSAMRLMLLDVSSLNDELTPPASMRDELIALHESRYKTSGFKIWLNSLFTALTPQVEWHRPAMQLVGLAGVVLLVTVVYRTLTPEMGNAELAYEPEKTEEPSKQHEAEEVDTSELPKGSEVTSVENEPIDSPEIITYVEADQEELLGDKSNAQFDMGSVDAPANEVTQITVEREDDEIIEDEMARSFDLEEEYQKVEGKKQLEEIEGVMEDQLAKTYTRELEETSSDAEVEVITNKIEANAPSSNELSSDIVLQDKYSLTAFSAARVPNELLSHLFTAW